MEKNSILVIGARDAMRGFLQVSLSGRFQCLWADTPRLAAEMLLVHKPGLLLWDMTGRHTPGRLPAAARGIPFLVLRDKELRLPQGARGEIRMELVSPFGLDALLRAVETLYPSRVPPALEGFQTGVWHMDFIGHTARRGEDVLHLTPLETAALLLLAQNAGRPVSNDQLIAYIWGQDGRHDAISLRGFMAHLRRKLGDEDKPHQVILTYPGQGYGISGQPFNKNDMSGEKGCDIIH